MRHCYHKNETRSKDPYFFITEENQLIWGGGRGGGIFSYSHGIRTKHPSSMSRLEYYQKNCMCSGGAVFFTGNTNSTVNNLWRRAIASRKHQMTSTEQVDKDLLDMTVTVTTDTYTAVILFKMAITEGLNAAYRAWVLKYISIHCYTCDVTILKLHSTTNIWCSYHRQSQERKKIIQIHLHKPRIVDKKWSTRWWRTLARKEHKQNWLSFVVVWFCHLPRSLSTTGDGNTLHFNAVDPIHQNYLPEQESINISKHGRRTVESHWWHFFRGLNKPNQGTGGGGGQKRCFDFLTPKKLTIHCSLSHGQLDVLFLPNSDFQNATQLRDNWVFSGEGTDLDRQNGTQHQQHQLHTATIIQHN